MTYFEEERLEAYRNGEYDKKKKKDHRFEDECAINFDDDREEEVSTTLHFG